MFALNLMILIKFNSETVHSTSIWQGCDVENSQNWKVNWGPSSNTTSCGRPWSRKTRKNTASTISQVEGNLGRAIKWAILEKWPMTLQTTVLTFEGGKPVMKSNDTWDQGQSGTGNGLRSPSASLHETLLWAQTGQADIYSRVSSTRKAETANVRFYSPRDDSFTRKHAPTVGLWNGAAPGQRADQEDSHLGLMLLEAHAWPLFARPRSPLWPHSPGRDGSCIPGAVSSNCCEKASGLILQDPEWLERLKLNLAKKRAQLACQELI